MEVKTLQPRQPESPIPSKDWFTEIDYVGNIELLNRPLLAIFSSAKCPARLILKAHDYAKALSARHQAVIGGFQSPVEKEMLTVLLRGASPIVVCPARGLEGMRIPAAWQPKLAQGQLLVISPFSANVKRPRLETVQQRNALVAQLANELLIVHAEPGGKVEALARAAQTTGQKISHL